MKNITYKCVTVLSQVSVVWSQTVRYFETRTWSKVLYYVGRGYTKLQTQKLVTYHYRNQWRTERGSDAPPLPKFRSFDKAEPNSQFRGKHIRNNLIRIRVSPICKLRRTPDKGATAPISPFYSHLPLTEFVEPPPPLEKKFLGTPLIGTKRCLSSTEMKSAKHNKYLAV
jgi:hypothetical protein